MKFIDFFAGIGGFRKGLEDAGHKCVGFCEIDKFAIASYTAMHLATKEQLNYVNSLPKSKRVKEIVKDVYKNGEWSATDIRAVSASDIPKADCWCFGAPCQDFSIAGKRAGLNGDKSSLVREIFRLLEERKEEDRPEWIIYENVKGMLSSERGLNFLSILAEMDRLGYDAEWQNINSKWFVPQNRERIYTLGHFRARGFRKILPIGGTDGKSKVLQVASSPSRTRLNPNQGRTYSPDGIAPCLCTMEGGNLEPRIVTKTVGQQNGRITSEGVLNRKNKTSGVLVEQKPCVIGGVGEKNFGSQYRQLKNLLGYHCMNEDWTNEGGWLDCDMRRWLNSEVLNLLPEELLAVIKPRKFGNEEDKLWLFSEMEIFGDHDWVENDPDRGFQFEYFQNPDNRVKLDEYGNTHTWWERSPYASSGTSYCLVNSGGSATSFGAIYSRGVCFGFYI